MRHQHQHEVVLLGYKQLVADDVAETSAGLAELLLQRLDFLLQRGKIVGEGKAKVGWFDTSTLKEPYRIEGKKTMGLELA